MTPQANLTYYIPNYPQDEILRVSVKLSAL